MGKTMSTDQVRVIWARACELIKGEINPVSYNTFIEVLTPISIVDGSMVVAAPTDLIQSTIDKYYHHILNGCLARTTDGITNVKVILSNEREYYEQTESVPFSFSNLFEKYTFDTFVVGSSNHFAHAAAFAVAQRPANEYNPLFIYGGVGLGKTHLLHAVGNYVKNFNPQASVMYVTSETFTNEMIQSISSNKNKEFRNKYRNVDVLMVDDIQFIARKEGVQEEFFHTFNALHNANKQIIISSDKPPKEISQLEERLRSRFEWGLIADIQTPDLETRIAILKKRAQEESTIVPDSVLEFIAEHVQSNIRELEGCLTRVIAYAQFNRMDLNVQVASTALKDILPYDTQQIITPFIIREAVASYYGIPEDMMTAKRKDQEVAFPRQVAMFLCRTMTDSSLPKIGDAFGGRNHTTVIHAYNNISEKMKNDAALVSSIEDIKKRLLT